MTTHRIAVGVDGSEGGRRALAWALSRAAESGAEVDVITVFLYAGSPDPHHIPSQRAARRCQDAQRVQDRDVAAALIAAPGTPAVNRYVVPAAAVAGALAAAAAGAELLVLGSHGHGALETRLLGTVSSDCLHAARCPVVVVPENWVDAMPASRVAASTS